MKKGFLTIEEVSSYLDVDTQLIYKLIKSKQLPAFKIGRVYRIRQVDLEEYIASCMTETNSGGTCGICKKQYHSNQMLRYQCGETDCDVRICVDCYERCEVKKCEEHG